MSFFPGKDESENKGQKLLSMQTSRTFGKAIQRPPVPIDPPSLTRIYKETCQRVKLSIDSLRSDAVFLLVCDEDKQVIAWFGGESEPEDREIALRVGLEIAMKDYGNDEIDEIPVILEDLERSIQLRYFLDKLWEDEATYRGKIAKEARRKPIINSPVYVYIIEKLYSDSYLLKEVRRALPNEQGCVPRVAFAPVDKSTVVAICVGDQWDLWIARGALADTDNVQTFLANHIAEKSENFQNDFDGLAGFETSQNIRVVMQGCERRLFRLTFKLLTDFEPAGRTIPYVPTREDTVTTGASFSDRGDRKPKRNQFEETSDFDEIPTVPEAIGIDELSPKNGSDFSKKVTFGEEPKGPSAGRVNQDLTNDIAPPSVAAEFKDRKQNIGKYFIEKPEYLELREEESLSIEARFELLEKSLNDPRILLGWQVNVELNTFETPNFRYLLYVLRFRSKSMKVLTQEFM